MKRVFLDTNILLDFGLGRKGAEEAEKSSPLAWQE